MSTNETKYAVRKMKRDERIGYRPWYSFVQPRRPRRRGYYFHHGLHLYSTAAEIATVMNSWEPRFHFDVVPHPDIDELAKHTPECNHKMLWAFTAMRDWLLQYPDQCVECHGTGFHEYDFDPSSGGISLGSGTMRDVSVCMCIEKGYCPLCSAPLVDHAGSLICSNCQWHENLEIKAPGLPDECFCPSPRWDDNDGPY